MFPKNDKLTKEGPAIIAMCFISKFEIKIRNRNIDEIHWSCIK